MGLIHGGNLAAASREFGAPAAGWIDLSTGISPWSWPVPPVPDAVWQRLPENDDGLLDSAAAYYRCAAGNLLAVPGSQHAIRQLPTLWPPGPVALPLWGYREHHHAWQLAGHRPLIYRDAGELRRLVATGAVHHALVINPSNPTAEMTDTRLLTELAAGLASRDGRLVVDEAFIDADPGLSLIPYRPANAVVLRSLGKFFGLAGVRLGFVAAEAALIAPLRDGMNPWSVSHPARWIGSRALADSAWQQAQRQRLEDCSRRWLDTLAALFPALPWRRTAHFISAETAWPQARDLYRAAGRLGLLLRLMGPVDQRGVLRLGLPASEQWSRSVDTLQQIKEMHP